MTDLAQIQMMPGQTPYTKDELKTLYRLVRDAADGDPGEAGEPRSEGSSTSPDM